MKPTTIETNRMIANFMGKVETCSLFYIPEHSVLVRIPYSYECDTKEHFDAEELKYNLSWDWLKPVIDKINNEVIGIKTIDECTEIEWNMYTMISRMYIGVSIEQAYKCVDSFLTWYTIPC